MEHHRCAFSKARETRLEFFGAIGLVRRSNPLESLTRPCLIGIALALLSLLLPRPAAAQNLLSPVQGYLSVEPFELRKEFVFRFETLAERLGQGNVGEIDASNRAEIEGRIGEWLTGKCPVEADGKRLSFELDRVHFVRPDPEKGLVVEDRESVPVAEALVGVVFSTGWEAPPAELKVIWEVFPADGSEAVVEAGVRGNRAARKLTPEAAEFTWENEGIAMPALIRVPGVLSQPPGFLQEIWWIPLAILAFGMVRMLFSKRDREFKRLVVFRGLLLIIAVLLVNYGIYRSGKDTATSEIMTRDLADEISYALLRNIYHAFDFRSESDVYDALAESVSGDLLEQIYLEVQRSLQLETQGGARVRVSNVDLRNCQLRNADPSTGQFSANCEWVAVGTVTHWGHTHDRVNQYRARLDVAPIDTRWRLVGLALESEERIERKVK